MYFLKIQFRRFPSNFQSEPWMYDFPFQSQTSLAFLGFAFCRFHFFYMTFSIRILKWKNPMKKFPFLIVCSIDLSCSALGEFTRKRFWNEVSWRTARISPLTPSHTRLASHTAKTHCERSGLHVIICAVLIIRLQFSALVLQWTSVWWFN